MICRKRNIITTFIISIILFSSFEFTKVSMDFGLLFSANSKINEKEDINNQITTIGQTLDEKEGKFSNDLMKMIESDPDAVIEVILYIENKFLQYDYEEFELKNSNIPVNEYRELIYSETELKNQPLIDELTEIINNYGGEIISKSVILNALSIRIKAKYIISLAQLSQVSRIESDIKLEKRLNNSVPSITNYTGSTVPFQWNYSAYNGSGVTVGVVDTGIYNNTALIGRVIRGKDFTGGSNPNDLDGHGTHVAGIIASNDMLYTGVAPGVDLINIKSLNTAGVGNSFWVINGIEWALVDNDFDIDIISMSAGASVEANGTNGFACFVDYIIKNYKILWINAAGNNGPSSTSIDVPGDAYNGITVGNVNDGNNIDRSSDLISSSSSRGPTDDIPRNKPDISAPGQNIMSCNNGVGFVPLSGTSMATPHVAGAAALLWQYYKENPISGITEDYYPMLIKSILLHTAEDKGTTGSDYTYGHGYIDMVNANKFSNYGNALVDSFNTIGSSVFKYKVEFTENSEFNLSLLWYKEATYDIDLHMYTGWQENAISNLDISLEDANYQTLIASSHLYNNYENFEINCTPGTYYVKVQVKNRALHASPEEFIIISSAPLEKILWLDTWTILFTVLIVGSVIAIIIILIYYFKSRNGEEPEDQLDFSYQPTEEEYPY